MSLQLPVSDNSFLRTINIHLDTEVHKLESTQDNFRYRLEVPDPVSNVVSARLVNFSSGPDFVPTFYPGVSGVQAGNNKLDFRLQNADINAGVATDFSVTLPSRRFFYFDSPDLEGDYTDMLGRAIQDAIDANATWADQVIINVNTHPEQKTVIVVGNSPYLPSSSSTTMTLLFSTGSNAANNPGATIGFAGTSDVTSNLGLDFGNSTTQSIVSPGAVGLLTTPFVDMDIVQLRQVVPFKRIYMDTNEIKPDVRSTRYPTIINTNEPPRNLRFLDVILTWQGGAKPSDFHSGGAHKFTLSLTFMQDWPLEIPNYLKQEYIT